MRPCFLWLTLCATLLLQFPAQKGLAMEPTFADDVALLKKHFEVIVLSQGEARVAVCPALQGRVMTSSASGDNGPGFGWINREFIAAGKTVPHINVYGGEDRFWIGPEGGQFSIFFKKGDKFELKNWQTPPLIDTAVFDKLEDGVEASFRKDAKLMNYSGTEFNLRINRRILLNSPVATAMSLGVKLPASVKSVDYESINFLENRSDQTWKKDKGLLSIWILGMFKPGPQTTVVIPFKPGSDADLGPKVIDDYFGKVPAERLVIRDNVLFFSGDGKHRSKIGLSPRRALPVMGSYDAANGVLTIIEYNSYNRDHTTDYVNSKWEIQAHPFAGDVVNSYNDGPPAPGAKPLGPFYELESSSPARELKSREDVRHDQRTIHLQGTEADLDPIAKKVFGVSIAEIKAALPR